MAKKKKQIPDTRISLLLPGEGTLTRQASVIINRGERAFVQRFDYSSIGDIASGIAQVIQNFPEIEQLDLPDVKLTTEDNWKPEQEPDDTPGDVEASDEQYDGAAADTGDEDADEDADPLRVEGQIIESDERPKVDITAPDGSPVQMRMI